MKKLTMAAFAGTALLALAACADPDETEEPVVEETTVIDETVTRAARAGDLRPQTCGGGVTPLPSFPRMPA